jgi:hypothetical protein
VVDLSPQDAAAQFFCWTQSVPPAVAGGTDCIQQWILWLLRLLRPFPPFILNYKLAEYVKR